MAPPASPSSPLYLFYASYDVAFTPLIASYPTEIWQYALRADSVGLVLFSTQVALFFNIFANPIALDAIAWKYYIVFVAMLAIITAVMYVAYPETRGYSLEEIARVFDGDEAEFPKEETVLEDVRRSHSVKQVKPAVEAVVTVNIPEKT